MIDKSSPWWAYEWFDTLHPTPVPQPIVSPIEPNPIDVVQPALVIQGDNLAAKIAQAMLTHSYNLAIGDTVTNIVYVEGMNVSNDFLTGTKNAFRNNAFDCVRTLLRVHKDGRCDLIGAWDAITHAGRYWEVNPMNSHGAFHISLGQQACWVMGHYHDMRALVQDTDIVGTRDTHMTFKREGPLYKGQFGVHHHWGYNYPKDDAGRSSAGCQVGRTEDGHNHFIDLLLTDARYKDDHDFHWPSTVLPVEWVLT